MKTCLIVDDSAVVRKLASKLIEEIGFACSEAADGQQALDQCRDNMPDVMLLDWSMPVLDGMDCMKQLRGFPGGEEVKVIFLSTYTDMSKVEEAMREGADEYIMKPFDRDVIKTKFRQVGIL